MLNLNNLLRRREQRPSVTRLALLPAAVEAFAAVEASLQADAEHETDDEFWSPEGWMARYRPYKVRNGILTIPVSGVLVHGLPYTLPGWATGYTYIQRALNRAKSDGTVKKIVLDVDSPGGMVMGAFETADMIAKAGKPVEAYVSGLGYSAAYLLASQTDKITVSPSAGVGSIGVILRHIDASKAYEQAGLNVTLIYAGAHKKDGNPYEPLSELALKTLTKEVEDDYVAFVRAVSEGRELAEEIVRGTEAALYSAEEGLRANLVDSIMSEVDFWPRQTSSGGSSMDVNEATRAERTRIAAIMDSEEAKTRPAQARALALQTDMTVEAAVNLLKSFPAEAKAEPEAKAKAESEDNLFAKVMAAIGATGVKAQEEEKQEDDNSPQTIAARIISNSRFAKAK